MPHLSAELWTSLGFTMMVGLIALLSFSAYWSLRRMDEAVLRARMYMNRDRIFTGFLSIAIGMIVVFGSLLVGLVFILGLDTPAPAAVFLGGVTINLVFVAFGCFNFYSVARPPRGGTPGAQKGD